MSEARRRASRPIKAAHQLKADSVKILHHVRGFNTVDGGMQHVVKDLVEGMNAGTDFHCDVLCQGDVSEEVDRDGYRIYRRATTFTIASAGLSWRDYLTWAALRTRYQAVHVHAPWPQSNFNQILSPARRRVIVHWHSDIVRKRWLYSAFKPFEQVLLRRADCIVTTSPKLLDESQVLGTFRDKCVVVPIGVRDVRKRQGQVPLRDWIGGRHLVFALGRLVLYKGFSFLIQAAAQLPDDCCVVIGGRGPLRSFLEDEIAARGLAGKVKLAGYLSDENVRELMAACEVFCLPSVHNSEAFGIVQIEAMRAGKPVVSTRLRGSGVDWVNQDGVTGLVVPPGEPAALARAIAAVVSDTSLRQTLGSNARARYESDFTAEKMVTSMEAVYRSL